MFVARSHSRKGSNSRKSSNSKKPSKAQSKVKAIYDKKLREKSVRANSSMNKEPNKRPLSPTPNYLAADIARFQKLSQKLKADRGHSSFGLSQNPINALNFSQF